MQHSVSTDELGLSSSIYTSFAGSSAGYVAEVFNDLSKSFSEYDKITEEAPLDPTQKLLRPRRYMLPTIQRVRLRDRRPIWRGDGRGDGPSKLQWASAKEHSQPDVSPLSRIGASIVRIGVGDNMILLLFGGVDEEGLCSTEVRIFDPIHTRWCLPAEVGVVLGGEAPSQRCGHSACAMGRHVVLFFGGRTPTGTSDELHALVQHRAEMTVSVRSSGLSWSLPVVKDGPAPSARAYHAVAEMGSTMLLVGGEVRMRARERDERMNERQRANGTEAVLPPLHKRSEISLAPSVSAPSLLTRNGSDRGGGSPRAGSNVLSPPRSPPKSRGSPRASGLNTPGLGAGRPLAGSSSSKSIALYPTKAPPIAIREAADAASRAQSSSLKTRKERRLVYVPLADTWTLVRNAKGQFEWAKLTTSGQEPPPRSRAALVGLAERGLAFLFGGRSLRSNVLLNDAHILDVKMATWARTSLCGVPPTPRECSGGLAFGPGSAVLIWGGKGHACTSDAIVFDIDRRQWADRIDLTADLGLWELPWRQSHTPEARTCHMVAKLGSAKLLVCGGQRDDGSFCDDAPALIGECSPSALSPACVTLTAVSPRRVSTRGGDVITLRGSGFRPQTKIMVRFSAPRPLPLSPKPSAAMRFAADDESIIVDAAYLDFHTITCVAPSMIELMCDGHALLECCMIDPLETGHWWTSDEAVLELASRPQEIAALRPIGPTSIGHTQLGGFKQGKLAPLPVCTRYSRRMRALDVRGRRPAIELPLTCRMQRVGAPPPIESPKGVKDATPVSTLEATLTYLGEGTYELELWSAEMGNFEVVITSSKPPDAPPAAAPTGDDEEEADAGESKLPSELVYARFPISATPGHTNPDSCKLHVNGGTLGADGTLLLVAGNMCPFTVALFDHVGNAVDGAEASWTWQCVKVDDAAPGEVDEAALGSNHFAPLESSSFRLLTAGTYELHVNCGDSLVPSAAGVKGAPTMVSVMPSALSVTTSTVYGSGVHSRYPDGVEDEEREVVLIARDAYGNRLGHSPRELATFSVTLHPVEKAGGKAATSPASRGPSPPPAGEHDDTGAPAPAAPPGNVVKIIDSGDGVVRAVYPILELGSYSLTVSLGSELLLSKTIASGRAKDRPKNSPHWSEEERIFAIETSVDMQRAELMRKAQAKAAEDQRTERFQRQFKKPGQDDSPKKQALDASEIFRLVDDDASGQISEGEMRKYMELRGYAEDEILAAVKSLDVDGDGQISAQEFAALTGGDVDPTLEDLLMPYQAPDSVFEEIRRNDVAGGEGAVESPAQRSISLGQLKEIYLSQVVRRCVAEQWIGRRQGPDGKWTYAKLTPETVNLYDLASYVIVPATAPQKCSLIELCVGPEEQAPPEWVVSSPWRLPLHALILSLEAHARDLGLGDGARYWIAALALNQHELTETAVAANHLNLPFYQALTHSAGCVAIVDEEGESFDRVWCEYEAYLALAHPPSSTSRFCVYTPIAHAYYAPGSPMPEMRMAVGLVDGKARNPRAPAEEETWAAKLRREAPFPSYLLEMAIGERVVEAGQASRPADRTRILNAIAGLNGPKQIGNAPPAQHANFTFVNEVLKGHFAAFLLNAALLDTDAERCVRIIDTARKGRVRRMALTLEGSSDGIADEDAQTGAVTATLTAALDALDGATLTELRLDGLAHLVELPPRLLELSGLTQLTLSGATALEALPESLGASLPNLCALDLSGAVKIKQLPEDVSSLVELETLDLAGCTSLLKLPNRLGGAAALVEAKEDAGDGDAADATSGVPGLQLSRVNLTGCTKLFMLPDLSHLTDGERPTVEVLLTGCNDDLVMGWELGMRKAFTGSA